MSDRQAILDANSAFYRAFEKKDLTAMAQVWSQGTGSICIHPGRNHLQGWAAIATSWETIFAHTQYLEIDTTIIRVDNSPTLAAVVLTESVLQVSGRRRAQATSVATNVFEKLGSQWYLIHHHGSPIMG